MAATSTTKVASARHGWTRAGRKGAFRYLDRQGTQIRDEAKVERVQQLAIPPAWKDVWISPSPMAKLQATGYDKAGRNNVGWFRVGSERYPRDPARTGSRR